MRRYFSNVFAALVLGLAFFGQAQASAIVESMTGDVRAAQGQATPVAVARGQRINSGALISTGPKSQAVLRFDDGHLFVLNADTLFRIVNYSYDPQRPANDHSAFDLLKGALRSVTGLLGARNRQAFALRAPQATVGIRGTDFTVVIVPGTAVSARQPVLVAGLGAVPLQIAQLVPGGEQTIVSVAQGQVGVNGVNVSAGSSATVGANGVVSVGTGVPSAAGNAVNSLNSVNLSAGAGAGAGAGTGGLGGAAAAAGAAGALGLAGALTGGSENNASGTSTSTSTSTSTR